MKKFAEGRCKSKDS